MQGYCDSMSLYLYRMLLRHSFSELRSVQVAVIHCSAQTTATHVLQKLAQVRAIVVSMVSTGRCVLYEGVYGDLYQHWSGVPATRLRETHSLLEGSQSSKT